MRFRRRRRRPLAWFPGIGTNVTVGETVITKNAQELIFTVDGDGDITFAETALTFDFGQERMLQFAQQNVPTLTLDDIMGSGWQARRIVGSMFCCLSPTGFNAADVVANQPLAVLVTIGMMVRKVSQDGVPNDGTTNTQEQRDITDPWIWRRSWLLGRGARAVRNPSTAQLVFAPSGTGAATSDIDSGYSQFPPTNADYGSLREGTHVDAKCNRIIGPEDRLFMHVAATRVPLNPAQTTNGATINVLWDLRLLGNLRRFTNRRNASR